MPSEVSNTQGDPDARDLLTINLSGPGTIDHVINDTGGPVETSQLGRGQPGRQLTRDLADR